MRPVVKETIRHLNKCSLLLRIYHSTDANIRLLSLCHTLIMHTLVSVSNHNQILTLPVIMLK